MLTSFKLKHNQTVTDFLKVTLGVNKMVRKYQTHAIFVSPITFPSLWISKISVTHIMSPLKHDFFLHIFILKKKKQYIKHTNLQSLHIEL